MQKVSIAKICSITGIYSICCDNEKLFAFRNEEMATNISGRFAVKKKAHTHMLIRPSTSKSEQTSNILDCHMNTAQIQLKLG